MHRNINWGKLITLSILAMSTTFAQAQNNYWGNNPTPVYPNQNQMPYQNTTNYNHQSQPVQQTYNSFLKAEEQDMVTEINAVRTNPIGYIPQIENYIQTIEMDADFDSFYKQREIAAAKELINQLRNTSPMSSLQPHRGLYNAAISHGMDVQRQGRLNHTGSDGSQIWDRLGKVNGIVGGAENLVAGAHSAKESVIILLVDGGVPSRGHRKNILNPKWEFVADYVIGDVGGMPNAWIQLFGDGDGSQQAVAMNTNNNQPSEYTDRGWSNQPTTNYNNNWQTNQQPTDYSNNSWQRNNTTTYQVPTNRVTEYGIDVTPSNNEFRNRGNNSSNTNIPTSYNTNPTNTNSNTNMNSNTSSPISSGAVPSYMKSQEKSMIGEINLMRSNPSAYIKYVEEYMTEFQQSGWDAATVQEEMSSANELIQELRNTPSLSILKPYEALHKVAIKHGKDVQQQGQIGHVGSDGTWPWDRVKKMTDLSDGGENLVGGGENVRQSVIMLLVDSGIPSRGHRKALLDPKWEYVACYEIGMVGPQNDTWVQVFAKK